MSSKQQVQRLPVGGRTPPDTSPWGAEERELGDFATTRSVLGLAAAALLVGAAVACVALALLDLIGLITHLAYTGTLSTSLASPT